MKAPSPISPLRALCLPVLALACVAACGGPTEPDPIPVENALFGTVRITNSEVLLEGVRVWVEGTEDFTRPNGGYSLDDLPLGETRVFAELHGHERYARRVLVRPGGNVHDIFLVPLP